MAHQLPATSGFCIYCGKPLRLRQKPSRYYSFQTGERVVNTSYVCQSPMCRLAPAAPLLLVFIATASIIILFMSLRFVEYIISYP